MRFLKIITLFLILISSGLSFGQETKNELSTVVITISGMACQEGCADAINRNLKKLEGVKESEVSYETGKAIIQYDSILIPIDSITHHITSTKVKNYTYVIKAIEPKK